MNDLISRKALLAEYDRVHIGEPGKARKLIADAPTVDAVEVVRCKDCKWYNRNEDIMPQSGSCEFHEMVKMDWDFCSRAKMDGDGNA